MHAQENCQQAELEKGALRRRVDDLEALVADLQAERRILIQERDADIERQRLLQARVAEQQVELEVGRRSLDYVRD